jgi:hypothetical protein
MQAKVSSATLQDFEIFKLEYKIINGNIKYNTWRTFPVIEVVKTFLLRIPRFMIRSEKDRGE